MKRVSRSADGIDADADVVPPQVGALFGPAASMASMGISWAGWVAEATHAPDSMSMSETFTDEEPMSMPKLFIFRLGLSVVAGSPKSGK